jgi:acyl dehydratase
VTTSLTVADLRARIGEEIGTSDWQVVDQDRIDAFADATGDHQWIHVDVARARAETPFKSTIAHGFLTLSLISSLMRGAVSIDGLRMSINYGLNRVRFVSPLPAGSRVRAIVSLAALTDVDDAVQATWNVIVEREGGERPVLVAEWLVRYYAAPFEGGSGADGLEGGVEGRGREGPRR